MLYYITMLEVSLYDLDCWDITTFTLVVVAFTVTVEAIFFVMLVVVLLLFLL